MRKPFKNMIKKMPVDRQKRIQLKIGWLKKQSALVDLRPALDLAKKQVTDPGKTDKAVWETI